MRINKAGISFDNRRLAFKSLRTDKNNVGTLQNGTKPIGENQRLNILASLNNMANTPDRKSIEFLLGVAENLNYGQGGNSQFREELDERSETPSLRENTDWSKVLQDTIMQALANTTEEDVSDLQTKFEHLYSSKKELTAQQRKILALRDMINSQITSEEALADDDTLLTTARIKNNLDYFIASSEIPNSQKEECLDKFIYFLGDEYKINPQLEDKKLMVVDEMLNDMLVKTPESEVLTTKGVDQRYSGICAAISICRKAVAYEDKVQYMNIVMEELKDSSTMEVFDITELGSGKKVTVQKAEIDYDSAIAKGYRVVDASAHIWMQNAHASGDGTILTEAYTAFDDDSYNIYDDASWYECLDPNFMPAKKLMKALIKEKELLKAVDRRQKNISELSKSIHSTKGQILEMQGKTIGLLGQILSDIFPEKSQAEVTHLAKNVISFNKGNPDERIVNVPSKMDKKVQAQIIADYINSQNPQMSTEQKTKLDDKAKDILSLASDYTDYDSQLNKAKNLNLASSKYRYYKNLYQAAAAHRLAVEADVNMPDGIIRHERYSNIPPKEVRIVEYMSALRNSFSSQNVRAKYKSLDGTIPSAKALQAEITEDMLAIETRIPQELNMVLDNLIGQDMTGVLSGMLKSLYSIIDNGDKDMLSRMADTLMVKKDKPVVLSNMDKWIKKLENNPSSKDVQEAARVLGFEDTMQVATVVISSFFEQLRTGISEEDYNHLVNRFGKENISSALETSRLQFSGLVDDYNAILEKWAVPSSRTLIIDKMEKSHTILSRKKLDQLKRKFESIQEQIVQNEKIEDLKARRKANSKAYTFSAEEQEIFAQIEKAIPAMKKYSKNTYNDVNKYMFDALEKQYSYIGMLNGQFWVREEGSSGLSSNEQVRIIEQMTGEPYHIESDVNDAVKQIKKGEGSGILSTSVDDADYAFHAQYIPSVTSETFIDPITREKLVQDVLWTDNSWGKMERESYWDGRNGHNYTDYGRGFGWKDGFVLDDSYKIGLPVKDMHCAVGYAGKDKDKFGLFGDVVLRGIPIDTNQRLYKMFNNIFEMTEGQKYIEQLEELISNGERIDIDFLTGLDDLAQANTDKLERRIEKEIKSKADFDKLPDTDELKIAMNKLSLYFASDNPNLRESVYGLTSMEEIDDVKKAMFEEQVDTFAALMVKSDTNLENIYIATAKEFQGIFKTLEKNYGLSFEQDQINTILRSIFFDSESIKEHDGTIRGLERYFEDRVKLAAEQVSTNKLAKAYFIEQGTNAIKKYIDEDIRIKSLDSPALTSCPLKDEFFAAIDKYLKPESDEELLLLIQGFQEAGYELAETFVDVLEMEDVGLEFKEPYDFLRKLQTYDSNVARAFSEIVGTSYIYQHLAEVTTSENQNSAQDLYRAMHVKLADMDVQKYVKKFKAEAFAKYKLRQAFPQPVVFSNDEIAESVSRMVKTFKDEVYSIRGNQFVLELLDKKEDFAQKYADNEVYNALLKGKDVVVSGNEEIIDELYADLVSFKDFLEQDTSLSVIYEQYSKIVDELDAADSVVSGSIVAPAFRQINNIYADWEASGTNETKFMQNIKDEQAQLRNNIRVFVTSTIDPKYRNEAVERINTIINCYRKDSSSEEINWLVDEFTGFVIARHITKNPTVLLKEAVKCIQEGKKDSEEYSVLKTYLLSSLRVAQQTKVQYKLVQNQHEGIGSKTKNLLSMFKVQMSDGTSRPMDSEEGMIYLIEQLRNQGDNNVTLNLFLEQSGLTEKALTALLNNFDIEKSKEVMDENAKEVFKAIDDLSHLADILNEYFDRSRISYRSFEDAFAQIKKYVARKTKHDSNSPIYKNFLAYMDQVKVTETTVAVKSQMFKDIVASVTNGALDFLSNNINYKIEFIENIPELLADRADLMHAIKVPQNSEADKKRHEFTVRYMETAQYMTGLIQEIYAAVTETKAKQQPLG